MIPDRLLKEKPVPQQIGYLQAEETMDEQIRIAKHNSDLNLKLTIELRNYLLHLSIISATIIGVIATLGREIIQESTVGLIGFISLCLSLLGGVGVALIRTSQSIQHNAASYRKVSEGLDNQKELMFELMLGKKELQQTMESLESLKQTTVQEIRPAKPLKDDWLVWLIFGTFVLGVVFVLIQAVLTPA